MFCSGGGCMRVQRMRIYCLGLEEDVRRRIVPRAGRIYGEDTFDHSLCI